MDHSLLRAQMQSVLDGENAGGKTMNCSVLFVGADLVAEISRRSTCGGDSTTVKFRPCLSLEEALLHVKKYKEKGTFKHGDGKDD